MRRLAAIFASLSAVIVAGCAPWNVNAVPTPKLCQIWVKIDNGPWHCYERGEVLRELRKINPE